MRIKLDENIPVDLIDVLASCGHDVDSVPQEQLSGSVDDRVWDATQSASRFFVTQDLDFSDIRRYEPGSHHGLLLLRLREPSRRRLVEQIKELLSLPEAAAWSGCVVVVTDRKLRIRRPKESQ